MTDDKVKARIERYSHDLFGSDSHPYSGMRENDEGDFVSHEDYLALQSEIIELKEQINETREEVSIRLHQENTRLAKERDGLRAELKHEQESYNRAHESHEIEVEAIEKERDLYKSALEKIAELLPSCMGNSDVKEALVDRLIIARKTLEVK